MIALIGATILVFAGSRYMVDPIRALLLPTGDMMDDVYFTQEQYDAAAAKLHLDKPVPVQYGYWMWDLMRGDLGKDLTDIDRPIAPKIRDKFPISMQLGIPSYILATIIGIPLGVLSAVWRGSIWDLMGRGYAAFGAAVPTFWLAIMMIYFFGVRLEWLPIAGQSEDGIGVSHYIMPVTLMGLFSTAGYLRLVRSTMLEVLDSEFVKLARAKGLSSRQIIWKHAFRNALLAPLTVAGLMMVGFVTGSVVIETIFAWPGISAYAVEAVNDNNLPVLVVTTLIWTGLFIVSTFVVDILYGYLDPRIRYS